MLFLPLYVIMFLINGSMPGKGGLPIKAGKETMTKQKPFVPATLLSKLWRALIEFDMLQANDRILIGLSGGKDSMFLSAALAEIQRHSPIPFEVACYTVDAMFDDCFPAGELHSFCAAYGLKHYHEKVNVREAWQNKGNTPCFTCAYFRRAATNRKASELGCNKVALAHHHDDAVETFLMNILASGQLKTFLPATPLSRSGLTVLRPLLYYREEEIREAIEILGLKPLKNPCPYDGRTKRAEVKEQIAALCAGMPETYDHLAAAMRFSSAEELWPRQLSQQEMTSKFRAFWHKKQKEQ